jgi:hypothetical protein
MEQNAKPISLTEMSCQQVGHEGAKLVALCIDKNCTFPIKFACLDCIFQDHEQHKIVKLKLIQFKIKANLEN